MVSIPGALVVLLAFIVFASGQRKISRNTQASEEIKPEINFQCPEEFGYYPHPSDCTLYHVCFFGRPVLESCTGGLMYSPELQTCDWPRNVGCDGSGDLSIASIVSSSNPSTETRSRNTVVPKAPSPLSAQPSVIVTPRGQPRRLHHTQAIVKQQPQRYYEDEDDIPERDIQIQRTYRGQPAKVSDVQRDRDGLSPYGDNSIPSYSSRGEKIGVISFGTGQQSNPSYSINDFNDDITNDLKLRRRKRHTQRSRVEEASITPQKISTATAKALYNGTRHYTEQQQHYDPYEPYIYDDVELYRDIDDYPQHYISNNAGRQNTQNSYRGTPAAPVQVITTSEEVPKRRPIFEENTYITQDVYQPTVSDYRNDGYVDDQSSYIRQPNRQTSKGDRNDLNYIEEPSTTKRTTTIRTTTTTRTTTTPRPPPIQKSTAPPSRSPVSPNANQTRALLLPNILPEDRGQALNTNSSPQIPSNIGLTNDTETNNTETTYSGQDVTDLLSQNISLTENNKTTINRLNNFNVNLTQTTQKPSFYFITKASKSTPVIATTITTLASGEIEPLRQRSGWNKLKRIILPTTYAPPKFFLKYILPKSVASSTTTTTTTTTSDSLIPNTTITTYLTSSLPSKDDNDSDSSTMRKHRIISTIRKFINLIAINNEFAGVNDDVRMENLVNLQENQDSSNSTTTVKITTPTPSTTTTSTSDDHLELTPSLSKLNYDEPNVYIGPNQKRFRTTVEIPRPEDLLDRDNVQKQKPDVFPSYKPKPIKSLQPDLLTITNAEVPPKNTSIPARISRVNTSIKSLIALGGTRRPNTTSIDNQTTIQYNDLKQRSRNRGNLHYTTGGNGEAVPVNRGTPPPRTRSTLKPSTSIVSKAVEFVDIYRFPPRRPETIYPQPVPDKAAAKCRRDVCLLPDCSCGGKEIPGDMPVEQIPQMVLLTFDDSVNDLNKGLYADLFERGRVNPNGCPISATFYVSHEWTDYSQVQNLYSEGHEIASHTVSHSFGEQFSQKKWTKEVAGQREILSAYGGVKLEDVRGMRAPFLSVGGNKMFKMLYDSNFTYDSSMPIYENKPPSWPYTLDYKLFHDCMIPPCPTRSYPGVWEVPMVMWQDLTGGRCSMGDACSHPADAEGVVKLLKKNFQRHYTTNRAPFGLFYHAAYFTKDHHKEGFIQFLDYINSMKDVYLVTNWQAIQWVRDPTPLSRLSTYQPFQCNYSDRPKRCNNPKVCNLWHKSGVRYMRTCQPCPDIYPWTGNTGIRSSRIDNDIED